MVHDVLITVRAWITACHDMQRTHSWLMAWATAGVIFIARGNFHGVLITH